MPRGVNIETIARPAHYTQQELELACKIAWVLESRKFVLCQPPRFR